MKNSIYLVLGAVFGLILTKAQVVSWFRIQEMFRFQSFHMYGVIGAAVTVGALSLFIMKKIGLRTIADEEIDFSGKKFDKGVFIGGILFGLGWVLTGACPGPIFSLIGAGNTSYVIVLISAIAGTWCYGALKDRLPH